MEKRLIAKRTKARQEARPKKVMDIAGWTITADERQYIITNGKKTYYFGSLVSALNDIEKSLEKGNVKSELKDVVDSINRTQKEFLKALSTAVHSLDKEL